MTLIKRFSFLLLLNSALVHADTIPQWQIVPDKSSITFTATQNNAPVTGSFKTFTGEIFADPVHYAESHIDINVNVGSVTASYAELTSILITPDWFNIKEFPTAEFKSSKFNKIDDKTYEAVGVLTIKNKSVPTTLTFTAVESPKNNLHVEGHTTLKRTAFGIGQGEWAATDQIKDDVTVNFKIEALRKP